MKQYLIEKPKKVHSSKVDGLEIVNNPKEIFKSENPIYLYWSDIKYKTWTPRGMSKEKFWHLVKIARKNRMVIGFETKCWNVANNSLFFWINLDRFQNFCHKFDLSAGGSLIKCGENLSEEDKQVFIKRNVIEEAIASSQLEGAHTTRKVAKRILATGEKPRNQSEIMIVNNYNAMKQIKNEFKDRELSLDMIFKLHKILTKGDEGLKDDERGQFRKEEDEIVVGGGYQEYNHKAPDIKLVKKDIEKLIKFANDEYPNQFIHPLIKAIMLHFWIGYLHPFVDGNGRLARCLFYWYCLRHNYWVIAYLPISIKIKNSLSSYLNAYLYSEQDDNDLTYFIDYNVRKIEQAKIDFEYYCQKKMQILESLRKKYPELNSRQIELLDYLDKKNRYTSVSIHLNYFEISKITAIKDLKEMEEMKILWSEKTGREIRYYLIKKK